jgi:carbamoyl-phosphate synthase large subunit
LLSVCDGNTAKLHLFLENIEEYGIHHDDCASIIPAWSISDHQVALAEEMLNRIVHRFGIVGYVRLCVVVERHKVYVTGLSPYPGRNISFFERAAGLPIHDAAAAVMIGEKSCVEDIQMSSRLRRFYVKESVFPFQRFPSMNPALSPMMASTGQVMGHDDNFGKAYIKSQVAVNPRILKEGKVFISGRDAEKEPILRVAKKLLELNFLIVSTQGTAHFLIDKGVQVEKVNKLSERRPNIIDLIKNDEISLVINIPGGFQSKQDELIIRRASIEHNIPLVTTISGALLIVKGIEELEKRSLEVIPLEQ